MEDNLEFRGTGSPKSIIQRIRIRTPYMNTELQDNSRLGGYQTSKHSGHVADNTEGFTDFDTFLGS